jgi:tetratricopeptide (TPR) repeat protein
VAKKSVSSGEHAALLLSVGTSQCYRPECKQPLVVIRDGHRVVDFEIAHIRDELRPSDPSADIGWRYWPDDLSQKERNRYGNLLLLCPPCHKLIDKVEPRAFSVALLHQWKNAAEARDPAVAETLRDEPFDPELIAEAIRSALRQDDGVVLQLPHLSTPDGLSFASRSTAMTGRDVELERVAAFLESPESFSWWVVVGSAGIGKSRLALEACYSASTVWDVGFVSEAGQQAVLHLTPDRPTFLVVDYAASRASWLSDLLVSLVDRTKQPGPPVRVLILERDTSPSWFDVAVRRATHHQSVRVLSAQYAEPLVLRGLDRGATRELVQLAAKLNCQTLSSTETEDVVDRAFQLDPHGRPLFTLIACIERSDRTSRTSRDHLLRHLISRRQNQDDESAAAISRRSVALVATALGGISLSELLLLRQTPSQAALLAEPATLDSTALDRLLPGLVPDLLGELWLLDETDAPGTRGEVARLMIETAWAHSPQRYAAFVQRTLRDHPTHPAITELFPVDQAVDESTWFDMHANAIPFFGSPKWPAVGELIRRIETCPENPGRDEALAMARFGLANLHLNSGDQATAIEGYTALIENAPRDSKVRWQAHTNRGVVAFNTGRTDIAEADWNAVIEAKTASDESRACCLNNLADIHVSRGDHHAAIADRTAVLNLPATTYNRRYIALIRRASSNWQLERAHEAFEDVEAILSTEDIVTEQKMAARLLRVEWLLSAEHVTGVDELLRQELHEIVDSRRNFPDVERRALELLAGQTGNDLLPRPRPTTPKSGDFFAVVRGPR